MDLLIHTPTDADHKIFFHFGKHLAMSTREKKHGLVSEALISHLNAKYNESTDFTRMSSQQDL